MVKEHPSKINIIKSIDNNLVKKVEVKPPVVISTTPKLSLSIIFECVFAPTIIPVKNAIKVIINIIAHYFPDFKGVY